MCVPCAREDEGIAIAVGLNLAGRTTICLMEASGLGYSGLILARAQVQKTPVVIVASHSRGGGEPFDYHGATILVSEGIFEGLGIPYEVAMDTASIETGIERIFQTARGQLTSFGFLIPPHILAGAKT
jgi:sulfopyruvate decarboxylase subunit alpha